MNASGSDGAVVTLTIPAGALLLDTQITLTPILSAAGLPDGADRLVGIRLEPGGLDFYAPVTLDFELGDVSPESEALGLMANGDGTELHEYPTTRNRSRVTATLFHFTDFWIALGQELEGMHGVLAAITLTVANSQLASEFARLIRLKVPTEHLERRIRQFYTDHLLPGLATAASSCEFGKSFIPEAAAWAHFASISGIAAFQAELQAISDTTILWLRRCAAETLVDCLDGTQRQRDHLGYIQMLARLGESVVSPLPCETSEPPPTPPKPSLPSIPPCGKFGCGG